MKQHLASISQLAEAGEIIGACGIVLKQDGPEIYAHLDAGMDQHLARSCLMILLSNLEADLRSI